MDRRKFLSSVGAVGGGLMLPGCNPTQPYGPPKKVSENWRQDAFLIECAMAYRLNEKLLDLKEEVVDVHLCYDNVMWRSFRHGWIAWVEINPDIVPWGASNLFGTAWDFPLPATTRKVGMVFQANMCGTYPHKDEWEKLNKYGYTIADIAEQRMKERYLKG